MPVRYCIFLPAHEHTAALKALSAKGFRTVIFSAKCVAPAEASCFTGLQKHLINAPQKSAALFLHHRKQKTFSRFYKDGQVYTTTGTKAIKNIWDKGEGVAHAALFLYAAAQQDNL